MASSNVCGGGNGGGAVRCRAGRAYLCRVFELIATFTDGLGSIIFISHVIYSSLGGLVEACEFIQTNLYTVEAQGEIDVVGINLKEKKVYICEVAQRPETHGQIFARYRKRGQVL